MKYTYHKKTNKCAAILLLCFALLATMFTACSTKSGTSPETNRAEGLEEYGVGYFIKPVDYQAAVVDYFSEEVSEEIRKSREAELRELEEREGKELVDEIRIWCRGSMVFAEDFVTGSRRENHRV